MGQRIDRTAALELRQMHVLALRQDAAGTVSPATARWPTRTAGATVMCQYWIARPLPHSTVTLSPCVRVMVPSATA